jgi:excisionase family DNA binding protein
MVDSEHILEKLERLIASPPTKPPLLTTSQAAAYLGISKSTLYKLCSEHAIPYHKPGGKLNYFAVEDLDAYLLRNRVSSQSELSEEASCRLHAKRGI